MPLLLLDILRGRKVWEEEEVVGEEAERGRERIGLCAPVKWIERWTRKPAGDKKEIASVRAGPQGNMLMLLRAERFWFPLACNISLAAVKDTEHEC